MQSDFTMIVKEFPKGTDKVVIHPWGDWHIGSSQTDIKRLREKVNQVANDKDAYVIICGDMLDMGIVNSKTNIYEEKLMPQDQKELLYNMLLPIKDKILAVVPGNHEDRMVKRVGVNPLYDVCCRLKIEDVYRENIAFLKITILNRGHNERFYKYIGVVTHGSSMNKHQKFTQSIDGADFFISGHTHTPSFHTRSKLRIPPVSDTVYQVSYREIVVNSELEYSGYGAKKEYIPNAQENQTLELDGHKHRMTYKSH